jgi:hypothetical protein
LEFRIPTFSGGPTGIEVEPRGETKAEWNVNVTHENVNTVVNKEATGAHQDVQSNGESMEICQDTSIKGERMSVRTHM